MRYLQLLLCLGMAVVLVGCTDPLMLALHPLYGSDADVTFDAALVGSWQWVDATTGEPYPDAKEPSTFVFTKGAAGRGYYLTVTDKGLVKPSPPARKGSTREDLVGHWEARLVKVGTHEFLDVTPRLRELEMSRNLASAFIARLHVFVLVSKARGTVTLSLLPPEWWEEQLSKAAPPQQTTEVEGTALLITPTKDLRTILSSADFGRARLLPDFTLKRVPDPRQKRRPREGSSRGRPR